MGPPHAAATASRGEQLAFIQLLGDARLVEVRDARPSERDDLGHLAREGLPTARGREGDHPRVDLVEAALDPERVAATLLPGGVAPGTFGPDETDDHARSFGHRGGDVEAAQRAWWIVIAGGVGLALTAAILASLLRGD